MVDVDVVVDELEVVLQLGDLGNHVSAVGLHQGDPFLLAAVALADELGEEADHL